jgi:hypothetical protein
MRRMRAEERTRHRHCDDIALEEREDLAMAEREQRIAAGGRHGEGDQLEHRVFVRKVHCAHQYAHQDADLQALRRSSCWHTRYSSAQRGCGTARNAGTHDTALPNGAAHKPAALCATACRT